MRETMTKTLNGFWFWLALSAITAAMLAGGQVLSEATVAQAFRAVQIALPLLGVVTALAIAWQWVRRNSVDGGWIAAAVCLVLLGTSTLLLDKYYVPVG